MFNNHDIMLHSDQIRQKIKEMKMNDIEYQDYTYASTGSKVRVYGRIMKVYELLSQIIGKKVTMELKEYFQMRLKKSYGMKVIFVHIVEIKY